MKEKWFTGTSQHVYVKSQIIKLARVRSQSYDKKTRFMNGQRPFEILYPEFSKVLDTVSHNIIVSRQRYLEDWTTRVLKICLDCQALSSSYCIVL